MILSMATTSPAGDKAQGVLGSETDTASGQKDVTLIEGWDWFQGANPSMMGPNQYDLETVVVDGSATGRPRA